MSLDQLLNKEKYKLLKSLSWYPNRSNEKYKFGRKAKESEKYIMQNMEKLGLISIGISANGDPILSITKYGHFTYGLQKSKNLTENKNYLIKLYGYIYGAILRPKLR